MNRDWARWVLTSLPASTSSQLFDSVVSFLCHQSWTTYLSGRDTRHYLRGHFLLRVDFFTKTGFILLKLTSSFQMLAVSNQQGLFVGDVRNVCFRATQLNPCLMLTADMAHGRVHKCGTRQSSHKG